MIAPYLGFADGETLVARGRVLNAVKREDAVEGQSLWTNLKQMTALFLTDEVADVPVRADLAGIETKTGEEGYFTLTLPRGEIEHGWTNVRVSIPGKGVSAELPVQVPHPQAVRGVISDIDDTMMETGAYSLIRNIWTSLTGNALTRHVYPDAIKLIELLHDGRNPVFYVSSSPWNLHRFLEKIFARHKLSRGPMFLRDYGVSETQFITGTHGDHKGAAIDRILAANPDLPFTLIGDTGQHDPSVYRAAIERHPGRIERVIFRAPGSGIDRHDAEEVEAIRALGIEVHTGADYSRVIAALESGLPNA